jgi:integrase
MGSINAKANSGTLFFDFRYRGQRCREYTKLKDSPANRKRLKRILEHIEAEITLGTFDYGKYFPNSPRAKEFAVVEERVHQLRSGLPNFGEFAETWYSQMVVEWRDSYASTIRATLDRHLIPHFGERALDAITKADLLDFRVELSRKKGKKNDTLSAERINHIMTPLRMILNEAASRYEFPTPYQGIKSLKVPKTKVEPFTLVEVKRILETVRADFRPYYTVRFFTGMRTGEVDGLQWKYVDFERREIHVAESWVKGKMTTTKTDGSDRIIHMSQVVHDALKEQQKVTGKQRYVFCNRNGAPLNHNNVTKRVWYPLLRYLGLPERRPYQTRHTAATLWLAAGENPEWIAQQMGHTTTEMLFRVYSRYVPNLTRRDGSAFEALLENVIASSQQDAAGDTR